ncbi:CKLF-like MARVEL transmembrane domain-containing protein 2 isoform X2 [Dipodomys merriami]|uniref:CKLF-like MARVEL transmembrane domain-containing protein 2 isoform X2 n=1 Tax=Dipodomys merriami TaxID=94247 RepID=UPI003855E8E7
MDAKSQPPKTFGSRSKEIWDETKKGVAYHQNEVKESNRPFWINGHGIVKLLGLICLIASIKIFATTTAHPILTLILYMELFIAVFFLILYICAINRYLSFIIWPISVLMGLAAFFAFVDMCLQRRSFPGQEEKPKKPKAPKKAKEAKKGTA